MRKQRGQSAVEFALMLPMILLMVFGAIYGGAMFIQFMNYNNEARRIARDIAVASSTEKRVALVKNKYNGVAVDSNGETLGGIYLVTLTTQLIKDNVDVTDTDAANATDVHVRYDFDHGREFLFGFPPRHFATSYHMKLENSD